jgi:hypothetical protein
MVVGGQIVRVNASPAQPTYFDGFSSWDDLNWLNMLEVHGQRSAEDVGWGGETVIHASYIGTRLWGKGETRVVGKVSLHDPAAKAFNIWMMRVYYKDAQIAPGIRIEDGLNLAVYGLTIQGRCYCYEMNALSIAPGDVQESGRGIFVLDGVITELRAPGLLVINSTLVDVRLAEVAGGTGADLRPGRLVKIVGTGGMPARATSATLRPATQVPVADLAADITDYIGPQSFLLRSAAVDAGSAQYRGLTPDNLGNAVRVQVSGRVASTRVVADVVDVVVPAAGESRTLIGNVTGYDPATRRFRLAGLATELELAPGVRWVAMSPMQFTDGFRVSVLAVPSQAIPWRVTEVRSQPAANEFMLAGLAGDVKAGSFVLNANLIVVSAATRFLGATGTATDLVNGRYVKVRAQRDSASRIMALEIDARSALVDEAKVRGVVTELVTEFIMRVGVQRVDVRNAAFIPADLRSSFGPGQYVDVAGRMDGSGVLQARTVERI